MRRRDFFAQTILAGIASVEDSAASPGRLSPCLNEATTLDAPFEADCEAYSAAGFKHIELWFPKLRKQGLTPSQVGNMLRQHGLTPVSACASDGCLWREQGSVDAHLPELEQNFEMAQTLGVPRYVVFSFVAGRIAPDDYKTATERFVKIAQVAARYRVRIAFEFIARSSLFGSLVTSARMLRQAQQPNAGICLDTFHFFAGISKFGDLAYLRPGEIEHVHFHDVPGTIPREILVDPDRIPPGQGVIPLGRIVAALRRIGYSGNLSTELFGAKYQKGNVWSIARLCYKALKPYCVGNRLDL